MDGWCVYIAWIVGFRCVFVRVVDVMGGCVYYKYIYTFVCTLYTYIADGFAGGKMREGGWMREFLVLPKRVNVFMRLFVVSIIMCTVVCLCPRE